MAFLARLTRDRRDGRPSYIYSFIFNEKNSNLTHGLSAVRRTRAVKHVSSPISDMKGFIDLTLYK